MDIVFADWVVFYLVGAGFDCFLKRTTNSGVLACLDTFCPPLVYAGGFSVFGVFGRGVVVMSGC